MKHRRRRSPQALPVRLVGGGALLFLGGYFLLQHLTSIGADPAPGRVLFWGGLVLMVVGAAKWLTQPPARTRQQEEEAEEAEIEHATVSAALANDDDDDDLVPCPYCREPICEESERCPNCGKYISVEDAPKAMPTWILVGVVLAIVVTMFWMVIVH